MLSDAASPSSFDDPTLVQYQFKKETFPHIEEAFEQFYAASFSSLIEREKVERVNRILLQYVLDAPLDHFLLSAVIDYIERVRREKILEQIYNFNRFELWLNQLSGLSKEKNAHVRAKIMGKSIWRDEYQISFPIGMNKFYQGSHFVTAHSSPDVDTTIASFWTWCDAFSARITDGLHIWNLPGGKAPSQIESLFHTHFGEGIFSYVAKGREDLIVTSMDLVTQTGLIKKQPYDHTSTIDRERKEQALIVVDSEGFYLGDWRSLDIESIRTVTVAVNNCLRWFENELQIKLASLFTKQELHIQDISLFLTSIFGRQIQECEPVKDLSDDRKKSLSSCLKIVFGLDKGIASDFGEFDAALEALSLLEFRDFRMAAQSLASSELFDDNGIFKENRPHIFFEIEKVIKALDAAIQSVRLYLDRLDVSLKIKHQVLGYASQYVTLRSDLEEIKTKMGAYQHLTVVYADSKERLTPVGIVLAADLRKNFLATVSMRDFCNHTEIKLPSYMQVISVVDHHRSDLQTTAAIAASIADVQSVNVLLAEQAMKISDCYSSGGIGEQEIQQQITHWHAQPSSVMRCRLLQKLLQKQNVWHRNKDFYFISPQREYLEYLCYLYAIIDDTDLLSKVSTRDVACVAELLNRLKTLQMKKEIETVDLDHIPRDENFAKKAAKVILKNRDMYSLYQQLYDLKEKEVDQNIQACAQGQTSNIFADTKEQNGCCRIGQTKIFANNYALFTNLRNAVQAQWLLQCQRVHEKRPVVDLYLHMISTIVDAKQVYSDDGVEYTHQDELWIWVPMTRQSLEHLSCYLHAFKSSSEAKNHPFEVECSGANASVLADIFANHFPATIAKAAENAASNLDIVVLRYKAGLLNSRKASVSPYLPTCET